MLLGAAFDIPLPAGWVLLASADQLTQGVVVCLGKMVAAVLVAELFPPRCVSQTSHRSSQK